MSAYHLRPETGDRLLQKYGHSMILWRCECDDCAWLYGVGLFLHIQKNAVDGVEILQDDELIVAYFSTAPMAGDAVVSNGVAYAVIEVTELEWDDKPIYLIRGRP